MSVKSDNSTRRDSTAESEVPIASVNTHVLDLIAEKVFESNLLFHKIQ